MPYLQAHEYSMVRTSQHTILQSDILAVGLSVTTPPQAPRIFARTTERGIPLPALLLTSSVSGLCFGSSFIGSGTLWAWLQNLVGVSNQVCQMFRYYFPRLIATVRLLGFP